MSDHRPLARRSVVLGTLAAMPLLAAPALGRGARPLERIGGAAFGSEWSILLPAGTGAGGLLAAARDALAPVRRKIKDSATVNTILQALLRQGVTRPAVGVRNGPQ